MTAPSIKPSRQLAVTMGPGWQAQGEIMQLQGITTPEVEAIRPDATLQEAAQQMRASTISWHSVASHWPA